MDFLFRKYEYIQTKRTYYWLEYVKTRTDKRQIFIAVRCEGGLIFIGFPERATLVIEVAPFKIYHPQFKIGDKCVWLPIFLDTIRECFEDLN